MLQYFQGESYMKNQKDKNTTFSSVENDDLDNVIEEFLKTFNKQEIVDTKYQYTSLDVELVMDNPEEYIIPELLPACKNLWAMNIFTKMCSNRDENGHSYIWTTILSEENQTIFDKLKKEYPEFVGKQDSVCKIDFLTEDLSETEIKKLFNKIISCFKPQDVQKDFYVTAEQFLIDCGCYREIKNPRKEIGQPKLLKVFDKKKVKKPIEEYLKEKGVTTYDPETQRIYQSEFFLKRHLDFVEKFAQLEEKSEFTY